MFQNKMYQSNHKHNKCLQANNNNKTSNQEHKEQNLKMIQKIVILKMYKYNNKNIMNKKIHK